MDTDALETEKKQRLFSRRDTRDVGDNPIQIGQLKSTNKGEICALDLLLNQKIYLPLRPYSGCSSARLEYTSGGRVVEGSNPFTPTEYKVLIIGGLPLGRHLFLLLNLDLSRLRNDTSFSYPYVEAAGGFQMRDSSKRQRPRGE